jgi:hypothetical protein
MQVNIKNLSNWVSSSLSIMSASGEKPCSILSLICWSHKTPESNMSLNFYVLKPRTVDIATLNDTFATPL